VETERKGVGTNGILECKLHTGSRWKRAEQMNAGGQMKSKARSANPICNLETRTPDREDGQGAWVSETINTMTVGRSDSTPWSVQEGGELG
jgi:hypothetical protein